MLYWVYTYTVIVLFKVFFRLTVHGRENIPAAGGFIFASNHLSYLDPPVLAAVSPRKVAFMARHDLFRNRFFAAVIRSGNAFPVKRDSADLSAIKEAIKRVHKGEGLVLFPEGTRQKAGSQADPKKGIGFLAQKLDCPVIPVFIRGTDKVLPKGSKFFHLAKIEVFVGAQVPVVKGQSYDETAQGIMDAIRAQNIQVKGVS